LNPSLRVTYRDQPKLTAQLPTNIQMRKPSATLTHRRKLSFFLRLDQRNLDLCKLCAFKARLTDASFDSDAFLPRTKVRAASSSSFRDTVLRWTRSAIAEPVPSRIRLSSSDTSRPPKWKSGHRKCGFRGMKSPLVCAPTH